MGNKKGEVSDFLIWVIVGTVVLFIGAAAIYFSADHGVNLIKDIMEKIRGVFSFGR